ncbi:MAG: hypothetical protein AAF441_28390 [Pseudomonadota bacterium]
MRRFRQQTRGAGLALLLFPLPAEATVSLDGSNCLLFGGARPERELAQCVTFISGGHTLTVSLIGKAPNHVTRITLSRDGAPPFQILHTRVAPLISRTDIGVLFKDWNFDGHRDLGIMRTSDPVAAEPMRFFIFDPDAGEFVRSRELEELTAPRTDASSNRIISTRRQGVRRFEDHYAWRAGSLTLIERTERDLSTKSCRKITYAWHQNRQSESTERPC